MSLLSIKDSVPSHVRIFISSSSKNSLLVTENNHLSSSFNFPCIDPNLIAHYKPPLHVDEIGLTSDKYIPLNKTIHELPLTISYEPMSLQRFLLMDVIGGELSLNFTKLIYPY